MTLLRFYKPFGVLCQFTDRAPLCGGSAPAPRQAPTARATLADYVAVPHVYPAGRLDLDSEGLLLLTDDGALQARIAHPRHKLPKHYWVQVEATPTTAEVAALARRLAAGVPLRDGLARADAVTPLPPPDLPQRTPPVTAHRAARSSWLEVVLTSGRNRQVRRMLAAVGLPVLRLHRARVGPFDLQGLAPGEWDQVATPANLTGHPGARRPVRGRRRPSR